MNAFKQKNSTELLAAIVSSTLFIFAVDVYLPRGVDVWVFYLIPLILCPLGWQPSTPIIVSAIVTFLTIIGYFLDAAGVAAWIESLDRIFGILTFWTVGIIGHMFLRYKLVVREQEWLRAAQTGVGEWIQGEQKLPVLGEKIIGYLCEYLDAQVGVIYANEEGGVFRRLASYALDREANAGRESVLYAEGLTGQAIKDKRAIQVHDLPENYIQISSATGKAKPRNLLVAPALAEGEVEGVIEMGFARPITPSDLKLLKLVAEPIGMAVRASKYRNRLEELLTETQRQAEELQAQSEELRVANQGLEEQSRVLQESQVQLESQQVELEETNAQLEEQTQVLENQKQELTSAQSTLALHAEELTRTSAYKSEFLANMSHELRTPLNSLLILAKLLMDNKGGNLTPEQVTFSQTIYSAGNDLLDLINDVLDLSAIEAGKVTVLSEPIPIQNLLDRLTKTFRPQAEEKGLTFTVELDRKTPPAIISDTQRLLQILKNLLSNALKFTPSGSLILRATPFPGGTVAFSVVDTGIGIPKHQQQVIFEAFRQADGSTHRTYGGTGLGLSISKDLAKLLGGEITVQSVPGEGSIFTLILPLDGSAVRVPDRTARPLGLAASAGVGSSPGAEEVVVRPAKLEPVPAIDDRTETSVAARTLLVIEDDERFARILYDLAHDEGFQCLIAYTALDGLSLARKHHPKAIVLDINLPDQSGLYVLDQLKRHALTRHIPVHVVSVDDYIQTALELGAVSYAMKPVRREELVASLRKTEARFDEPVRRILIVEDDDTQREAVRSLLQAPGIEITAVATASETLEKLQQSRFDCVVMDLGLEDMSGYELLNRMTDLGIFASPPVIIYTGRSLQAVDEQRLRRYSRSIIIKGARSPERLLDEVTLFLHRVESRLPANQQAMLQSVRDRDSALEGRRILVVEDDVRNVFAITSVLEPKGAKVEIARNGKEAINTLDQAAENGKTVDLVLMDIMMPEMDGLTATKEIRSRSQWSKVPIIALTAKAMPDDRERCLRSGANDYIMKPLDVDRLLSLIRVWMPKT